MGLGAPGRTRTCNLRIRSRPTAVHAVSTGCSRPRWSGRVHRPTDAVLSCGVVPGGMTNGMTKPTLLVAARSNDLTSHPEVQTHRSPWCTSGIVVASAMIPSSAPAHSCCLVLPSLTSRLERPKRRYHRHDHLTWEAEAGEGRPWDGSGAPAVSSQATVWRRRILPLAGSHGPRPAPTPAVRMPPCHLEPGGHPGAIVLGSMLTTKRKLVGEQRRGRRPDSRRHAAPVGSWEPSPRNCGGHCSSCSP